MMAGAGNKLTQKRLLGWRLGFAGASSSSRTSVTDHESRAPPSRLINRCGQRRALATLKCGCWSWVSGAFRASGFMARHIESPGRATQTRGAEDRAALRFSGGHLLRSQAPQKP